jgi:hypothetical protein
MVPGMMSAAGGPLLDSFRSGLGFDYDAIGEDTLCGLCRCAYCSVCSHDLSLGLSRRLAFCAGPFNMGVHGPFRGIASTLHLRQAPCPRFLHGPTQRMDSLSAWSGMPAPPMHHAYWPCSALGVWPRHCLADRLASLSGMKEKLEIGIKIADVGCGCAWSIINLT